MGRLLSYLHSRDKDSDVKGESLEMIMKVEEVERIDRPPSPRMTRKHSSIGFVLM